jgi:hypothetical protein
MKKRGFIVAVILLFVILVIPGSFAQAAGCCVYTPNNPPSVGDSCQSITSNEAQICIEDGGSFQSQSCSAVFECQERCLKCQIPGGGLDREWGSLAQGCTAVDSELVGYESPQDPAFDSQNECESSSAPITSPGVFNTISGTVVDSSGNGVANAIVTCPLSDDVTTSTGAFSLVGCSNQTTSLTASTSTLFGTTTLTQSQRLQLQTAAVSGITISVLPFTAQPSKDITINILNAAQQPVVARVTLTNVSGVPETKTGSSLQFKIVQGPVFVEAVPQVGGYSTFAQTIDMGAGTGPAYTIQLTALQTITISGNVIDGATNQLLPGTTVRVLDSNGVQLFSTTATTGTYNIQAPQGQTFTLRANYTTRTYQQSHIYAQDTTVNIIIPPEIITTLTGTLNIYAREGTTGIEGAAVQVFTGSAYLSETTDENGLATFTALPTGLQYPIFVSHDDYLPNPKIQSVTLSAASQTENIFLTSKRQINIIGKVNSTRDTRLAGATVYIPNGDSDVTNAIDGGFNLAHKDNNLAVSVYARAAGFITKSVLVTAAQVAATPINGNLNIGTITLVPAECNDPNQPGLLEVSTQQAGDEINVDWSSQCAPQGAFRILRSVNGGNTTLKATSTSLSYTDEDIDGDTNYCYTVEADIDFGGDVGLVTVSGQSCIENTGAEQCFEGNVAFCEENDRKRCNDGIVEDVASCSNNQVCVELSDAATTCRQVQQCKLCNRPFGVFSQRPSQAVTATSPLFGGRGFSLIDNQLILFSCDEEDIACYEDVSKTVVQKHYSCENIKSCYDYLSKNACEGNNKCIPSQDCEWVEAEFAELGIGVCRPKDVIEQNCREFEKDRSDIVENSVFAPKAGELARALCELYGDRQQDKYCYFTSNECKNQEEVSCYDYEEEQACIGPNELHQTTDNVSINVVWGIVPGSTRYKKVNGNNEKIAPSSDLFEIGICKFVSSTCIRDADDNEGRDTDYPTGNVPGIGVISFEKIQDCSTSDTTCSLDAIPPETTIKATQYVTDINFDYDVVDESSIITTYFDAFKQPISGLTKTYPQKKTTSYGNKIAVSLPTSPSPDGAWTIFYFSEDRSSNLEPLKNMTIIIDKTKPTITFERIITPDLDNKEVDVLIQLTSNEPARCTAILHDETNGNDIIPDPENTDMGPEFKTTWSETYLGIPTYDDGIRVKYTFECFDRAGNKADFNVKQFDLDANNILDNPVPSISPVPARAVQISIETLFDGSCKFTNNPGSSYDSWTDLANKEPIIDPTGLTAGYKHSTTYNVDSQKQFERLKVGCNLAGVSEVVYGSDADDIKITVDDKAPVTTVVNSTGHEITGQIWVNGNTIKLSCHDPEQRQTGMPEESKCRQVYFCDETIDGTDCIPQATGQTESVPQITQTTALRFYSEDDLFNTEGPQEKLINYDGEAPDVNLSSPLDEQFVVTRAAAIQLRGNIFNSGAPLKFGGTRYVIREGANIVGTSIIPLDPTTLFNSIISIPLTPLQLPVASAVYTVIVESEDLAGNKGSKNIVVVRDSRGPKLDQSGYEAVFTGTGGTTIVPRPFAIEFGRNFDINVRNVLDDYAYETSSAALQNRVSSVWIKDMFNTRYDLTKTVSGAWQGTIPTGSWPLIGTYNLTVFSNDSLNNVAEYVINFTLQDTVPPTADIRLENVYGDSIGTIVAGTNYVVLAASESLRNATLSFNITDATGHTNQHDVMFVAKDFQSLTWTGIVDVPEGISGTAELVGILTDLNGVESIDGDEFRPSSAFADLSGIQEPLGGIYSEETTTSYVRTPVVEYFLDSGNEYQFKVNGKYVDEANGIVSGFNEGDNVVEIRVEDIYGNYDVFTQNVFVDTKAPIITTELNKTYQSASQFIIPFIDSSPSSGINNESSKTFVSITNSTGSTIALSLSGSVTSGQFTAPNLPEGDYTGIVKISDMADNAIQRNFKFRISSSAPSVGISSDDLALVDGIYVTNKENPAIQFTGITDQIITGQTSGFVNDGFYSITASDANGNYWTFVIEKDGTAPQFGTIDIGTESITNGQPLFGRVSLSNPENHPASMSRSATIDGSSLSISLSTSLGTTPSFVLDQNVAASGQKTVSITLTDAAANQYTGPQDIFVDTTPPTIPEAISFENFQQIRGELVSNSQYVSFSGEYPAITITGGVGAAALSISTYNQNSISNVYVIGADQKIYPATLDAANDEYSVSGVKLIGRTFEETPNTLQLIFEDAAGNTASKSFVIIKDLQPPELINLLFTRTLR